MLLVNLCRIVPHGLLVFFPSYSVLAGALEAWKAPSVPGRCGQHGGGGVTLLASARKLVGEVRVKLEGEIMGVMCLMWHLVAYWCAEFTFSAFHFTRVCIHNA